MNETDAQLLIVTDDSGDSDQLAGILVEDYTRVHQSSVTGDAAKDFAKLQPDILLLAYKDLARSIDFHGELTKQGSLNAESTCYIIVLCNKEKVEDAYQLCRTGTVDDYVVFWPLTYDNRRLNMTVRIGLRNLANRSGGSTTDDAYHSTNLSAIVEDSAGHGRARADAIMHSLSDANSNIAGALNGMATRIGQSSGPGMGNLERQALAQDLRRLQAEEVRGQLEAVGDSVLAMDAWINEMPYKLAPVDAAAKPMSVPAGKQPLVLVVDDDIFQCRLLQQILMAANMEVVVAMSGTRSIEMANKRRPDLVLMDVNLPDFSGIEALKRLKNHAAFSSVPVVMITGHSEREIVVESKQAGASDFIVKPFEKSVVLAKVRRYLIDATTRPS